MKRKVGVGLMQCEVEYVDAANDPEAFKRAVLGLQSADEVRDANARHVREGLERAAAQGGMSVVQLTATFAEEDRLFWDWLCVYERLGHERARPEPDIALVIEHAEQLGRLHERLWWRLGIDMATGARREALALQSRRSRMALDGDSDGGRASANAERHAKAEVWRQVAREVASTSPVRGQRLEKSILEELTRRGLPRRSGAAIRTAIAGIRRPD
jgi:hypothetical protein